MGKTVVVQKWEESELGWGCRPNGYSLHISEEARVKYIKDYWDKMPDSPPSEYSRPDGTPYLADVSDDKHRELEAAGGSLREYRGPLPGSGGIDGWRRLK